MTKGGAFENKICKQLSLWWSLGKHNDLFARASQSGGRASVAAKRARAAKEKKRVAEAGDLIAVDPEGMGLTNRFILECKCGYPKLNILNSMFGNDNMLWTWIDQAKRAAIDKFDDPHRFMLIVHQDRQPTWLISHCYNNPDEDDVRISSETLSPMLVISNSAHGVFSMCLFDKYIVFNSPNYLKETFPEIKR